MGALSIGRAIFKIAQCLYGVYEIFITILKVGLQLNLLEKNSRTENPNLHEVIWNYQS